MGWFKKENKLKILEEKQIIKNEILKSFSKGIGKQKPTEKEVKKYEEELNKLKLSELKTITANKTPEKKEPIVFKIKKKFDRKNAMLVTIHRRNDTKTHHVVNQKSRFIVIDDKKYWVETSSIRHDVLYDLPSLEYFEENPLPIMYKSHKTLGLPDTELLGESLHFEYATKLAKVSELQKKLDMTFIFCILAFVGAIINVALNVIMAQHMGIV